MPEIKNRVNDLKGSDIVYLTNGIGEELQAIAPNHLRWYNEIMLNGESLLCLVKLDGQVGVLIVVEISHPEDETFDRSWMSDTWRIADPETIWLHVQKQAEILSDSQEFNVYTGCQTGFLGCHEIAVFVPFTEERQRIAEIDALVEQLSFYF